MKSSHLFIQETGNSRHARQTKFQIRSHVMDTLLEQRKSNMGSTQSSPLGNCIGKCKCALGTCNLENIDTAITLAHSLTSAQDMLNVGGLAVQLTTHTRFLLHHFLYYRSRALCTVTMETGWLPYALKNVGLFHSTLYHWVLLNMDTIPTQFRRTDSLLRLQCTALRLINEQFRVQSTTDEVIASVACLTSVNLLVGDINEAVIHFKGLNAMVAARQGVSNLGFDGLIARLAKFADSCHAQVSNSRLFLEDPTAYRLNELEYNAKEFRLAYSPTITRLRNISSEMRNQSLEDLPLQRRVSLGQDLLASDRELLQLIHSNTPPLPLTISITATAALAYSQVALRGLSRSSRVLTTIVKSLKHLITNALTAPDSDMISDPAVLPWALLIGVLASESTSTECEWFVMCMQQACKNTPLDWEQVRLLIDAPIRYSSSFHWVLGDEILNMKNINTKFLS